MAWLTGTDAVVAGRCTAPRWIRWARSGWDGLIHAFPVEVSQQGRWLRAVCSDAVPPAALGPATVVGLRCPRSVLVVAAACAAPHREDRPGVCARLLVCRRRDRHDQQPAPLGQVPDIAFPPTTVESAGHERRARTRGVAGPGGDTAPRVVSPPP